MDPIYDANGVDIEITVTFPPGSVVTTLVGSTIDVTAQKGRNGPNITGSFSILSATKVRASFGAWTLAAGAMQIEVGCTAPGQKREVIHRQTYDIQASLLNAP